MSKPVTEIASSLSKATGWKQVHFKHTTTTGEVQEIVVTLKEDGIDTVKLVNDVVVK